MEPLPDTLTSLFGSSTGIAFLFLVIVAVVYLGPPVVRRRRPLSSDTDLADPRKQLEFVSGVAFETQPLLNKSEFQVLLVLEAVAKEMNCGFRVMAQTSLGEILRPRRHLLSATAADLAYRSINSKRADFIVVNAAGHAVLVVEYQGDGHYQGTAQLRDAVKREAFRTAGVTLIEVPARYRKDDIAKRARAALQRHGKGLPPAEVT